MRIITENHIAQDLKKLHPFTLGAIALVLLVVASIQITLSQVQKTQDIQQHAAEFANGKRPPCVNFGDINGDGVITILTSTVRGTPPQYPDADLITQYVAGTTKLTPQQISIADIDADGNVTSVDALKIARYAQGLEATFPICAKTGKVTPLVCGYYGDINGDKQLTEIDALEIQKSITAFPSLLQNNSYLQKAADVNGDGKVDVVDPLLIANYVNGRIQTLGVCTKTKPVSTLQATCSFAPAPGDVDGDGYVTNLDAQLVGIQVSGSVITGLTPITDASKLKNADADNNGKLDIVDALFIARYAEGLDPILKGCTVSPVTPTPTSYIYPTQTPTPTTTNSNSYCRTNTDCSPSFYCNTAMNQCMSLPTPTPIGAQYCRTDANCPRSYTCNTRTNLCERAIQTTPIPTTPTPTPYILSR